MTVRLDGPERFRSCGPRLCQYSPFITSSLRTQYHKSLIPTKAITIILQKLRLSGLYSLKHSTIYIHITHDIWLMAITSTFPRTYQGQHQLHASNSGSTIYPNLITRAGASGFGIPSTPCTICVPLSWMPIRPQKSAYLER